MNIRFVSAQRGKKTRSATSRYRRFGLENINRRLQFLTCQSKKEKERHAKREIRAVGRSVEYVTPPRLHYRRSGWASVAFATFSLQAKS